MPLWPHQQAAVDAAMLARDRGILRPLLVVPTGGGKSRIAAEIAWRIAAQQGRVLIVTHVRELIEQDAAACELVGLDVGIYSAGMDRRDTEHAVIVAGIQSAANAAEAFGKRDILILDECHRCRSDGDGQYHALIQGLRKANESITMLGLTATPYRTDSGMLTDGDPPLFDEITYSIEIPELIQRKLLCPLTSKQAASPDLRGVKVIAGDWSDGALGEVMGEQVKANCADLVKRAANRTRTLIFGCTIAHCEQIASELRAHGWAAPIVTGSTPDDERNYLIRSFRSGEIRALVNCQVLTTGFDAPATDCIALMRPTKSAGLYTQMCGRGFRIAEGKESCEILDYGGNILRHGPLDRLVIGKQGKGTGEAPWKVCPVCQEVLHLSARECDCGWIAPPLATKTTAKASDAQILGAEPKISAVQAWTCKNHTSKTGSVSLRVDYQLSIFSYVSEWVCFDHSGFPRLKAEEWWLRHGGHKIPASVAEAAKRFGELRQPASISVLKDGKFDRITGRSFAPKSLKP